jgi:hypothetical protein
MKTVADIKKRMKVGAKVKGFNNITGKDLKERVVGEINSRSFGLKTLNSEELIWCDFPQRSWVQFSGEDTFIILSKVDKVTPILTYTFCE